jgi:hypothetical protein
LQPLYGNEAWNGYFKFAFVRNPWDRLVSWWSMINGARPLFEAGQPLNRFQSFVLERARTFEEFLDRCDEEVVDPDGRKWIYRNQIEYLTDEAGQLMVDFVGRFETLTQDFETVRQKLGVVQVLPTENRSGHDHYTQYYSSAMAENVGRRYERDIARFGYRFGC